MTRLEVSGNLAIVPLVSKKKHKKAKAAASAHRSKFYQLDRNLTQYLFRVRTCQCSL